MNLQVRKLAENPTDLTPWLRFESSMGGAPKAEALYGIWSTETDLWVAFTVRGTSIYNNKIEPGSFYRGLWYFDCGELWLSSTATTRYLEFNLAPNGAWWSQSFHAERTPDAETEPPQCEGFGTVSENGWTAHLRVSWAEIRRALGDDATPRINVTLVKDGCPDKDCPLENLHTVAPLFGDQPNFHRPQDWIPIDQLTL